MNNINDYIMKNIFDKCLPNKPSKLEKEIYSKCISLNWIQPHHLIKKYDLYLDEDIIDNIKLFIREKSINKKLLLFQNINNSLSQFFKFSLPSENTLDFGVDDTMPLLNYFIIKLQPLLLYSNIKFLEIYQKELKYKIIGSQLSIWDSICRYIPNLNYNDLKGITSKEFENKCNEASKQIKY